MQVTPFENELLNLLKTNNKLLKLQNVLLEDIKNESKIPSTEILNKLEQMASQLIK